MRHKVAALAVIAAAAWTTAPVLGGQATVAAPGARQPRPPSAARIAPLPESEWTAEQRAVVAKVAPAGATDPAIKTLVRLPALVQALAPYTRYLTEESTLPPRVRHLLILRTAWLCGNDVVWSLHASGLPAAERRRVAQGVSASGWSEADQALLRTADELFRLSSVSDALATTAWIRSALPRVPKRPAGIRSSSRSCGPPTNCIGMPWSPTPPGRRSRRGSTRRCS